MLTRDISLPVGYDDHIRAYIAREFWKWYAKNSMDEVLTIRVLIFSKTIRVKDLLVLWVRLFGPMPVNI